MNWKKAENSRILAVKDFSKGVSGVMGEILRLPASERFPEGLEYFQLTDLETKELKNYWLDGGLRGAFKMNKIQPRMTVMLVYTGQTDIDGDKRVNTYDVFTAEGDVT